MDPPVDFRGGGGGGGGGKAGGGGGGGGVGGNSLQERFVTSCLFSCTSSPLDHFSEREPKHFHKICLPFLESMSVHLNQNLQIDIGIHGSQMVERPFLSCVTSRFD